MEREIAAYGVESHEMLIVLNNDELVLLSPFAFTSNFYIQTAQHSDELPCLYPTNYPENQPCDALHKPSCKPKPTSLQLSMVRICLHIIRHHLSSKILLRIVIDQIAVADEW